MVLESFPIPPWRLKRTSTLAAFCLVLAFLVPTSHPLSQESPAAESSKDLTKQLLKMDLGYNVLNNEMLRKSMGVSVDTLDHLDGEKHQQRQERLPEPQHLVRDKDVIRFGGPNPDGLWSDEKFWGGDFFGGFFDSNSQHPQKARPAAPQRHGGGVRRPQEHYEQPQVTYGPVRNDPRCGLSAQNRNVAQRRIVGGNEAGFGSFPWQAYVRVGTSRCGGSLLNEWYVVTAGHCVARSRPSQVRITLGEYVLKSDVEPLPGRTYGATEIKVHPNFKFTPQADRYDVAVVRLNRPVDYAPHISPICLPPKNMDMHGMQGWASGWGALKPGSSLRPKTLQVVDVPTIDNRECEGWHRDKGIRVVIYEEMMCAGYYDGGRDSCQGDSGGPLMTEVEGRWTLIGIVSAGYSCAKRGQPGIYHRVSYTSDWISHSISS